MRKVETRRRDVDGVRTDAILQSVGSRKRQRQQAKGKGKRQKANANANKGREGESKRQTDTQTAERRKDRKTERQKDRKTESGKDGQLETTECECCRWLEWKDGKCLRETRRKAQQRAGLQVRSQLALPSRAGG